MAKNDYSLIDEDDLQFHLQHPSGNKFSIAKHGLSDDMKNQISSYRPDRGPDEDAIFQPVAEETPDQLLAQNQPLQTQAAQAPQVPNPSLNQVQNTITGLEAAPEPIVGQPLAEPNPATIPGGENDLNQQLLGNISQQKTAMTGLTEGKTQASNAVIAANNAYQKQAVESENLQRKNLLQLEKDNAGLAEEIKKGVDPTSWWSSRTDGQKVGAAISLILGGIGQGMMKSNTNVALDIINGYIEKDIQAQMANKANARSLYSLNLQKYQDANLAARATQANLLNILNAQVGLATAQSNLSETIFNGQNLQIALTNDMITKMKQFAADRAVDQLSGVNTSQAGIPSGQLPHSVMADEKVADRLIEFNGREYLAKTSDDAKVLKEYQSELEPMKKNIQRLKEMLQNKSYNPLSGSAKEATALQSAMITSLNKMKGLGALTHEHTALLEKEIPNVNNILATSNGPAQLAAFEKRLNENTDAIYKNRIRGFQGREPIKSFKVKD